MRSLSADALAKINQKFGSEPLNIVEIDWVEGGTVAYADRDIEGIQGKLVSIGNLDSLLDVTRSNTSQEIPIQIDDSTGVIKGILDVNDIHQVDVRVFQYFAELPIEDKFLIFAGKLNSPVRWEQSTRVLSFSALSQIEDKEFGFSAEEGDISGLPSNLVGRPWPSIFGTVLDVPALQIGSPITGSTLCGVGYLAGQEGHASAGFGDLDCGTLTSLGIMSAQISHLNRVGGSSLDSDIIEQTNSVRRQRDNLISRIDLRRICAARERAARLNEAREIGEGCNPVRILGGEDFPQNTVLQIDINGMRLTGVMVGQDFTISNRSHAETDEAVEVALGQVRSVDSCNTAGGGSVTPYRFEGVSPSSGARIVSRGFSICDLPANDSPPTNQILQHIYADAGAQVSIYEGDSIAYVASITPGTVLDVKAHKQFEGETALVSIPPELYTVSVEDFGVVKATVIRMDRALSSLSDEGFSDDVFVTFRSDIGPNTVDVLEYIIGLYTDLDFDTASFDKVKTALVPFPSHFAVLDRRNTIDLIKDIAFQARCAVYVSNGKFFLKYLPEEPDSDKTLTLDDIELRSIAMTTTRTEDIVTKMNITYRISYAEEDQQIILRNNIARYGTREQDYDWFIYSNADIVYHAATFWLIRLSNMWKKLEFSGFLNLLELESFDTVTLDIPNYVAEGPIKAVVDMADYDSDNSQISFEVEVPVRMGFMEQHPFYWPANSTLTYPSAFDTSPGGGGLGSAASGTLPYVGVTAGSTGASGGSSASGGLLASTPFADLEQQQVVTGGPNAVFGARSDLGTRTPGDSNFNAGEVVIESAYVDVDNTRLPALDLTFSRLEPLGAETIQDLGSPLVIDIRNTIVVDSDNEGQSARLDAVFASIQDDQLTMRTDVTWRDDSQGTNIQGQFDFKYDEESDKFGAGTAFLDDD